MPMISDQEFAEFQQLKSGGAPGGAQAGGMRPPTPGQPGGGGQAGGYTPPAPGSWQWGTVPGRTPEQLERERQTDALQAAANPGWTLTPTQSGVGSYWSPDAAHNNDASRAAFQESWGTLARDNPRLFGIEGQGLYGEGTPGWVKDPVTGKMNHETSAAGQATLAAQGKAGAPAPGAAPAAAVAPAGAPAPAPAPPTGGMEAAQRAAMSTPGQPPSAPGAPAAVAQAAPWSPPGPPTGQEAYMRASQATATPGQTAAPYTPPATGDNAASRQAYYDSTVRPQYQAQQAAIGNTPNVDRMASAGDRMSPAPASTVDANAMQDNARRNMAAAATPGQRATGAPGPLTSGYWSPPQGAWGGR